MVWVTLPGITITFASILGLKWSTEKIFRELALSGVLTDQAIEVVAHQMRGTFSTIVFATFFFALLIALLGIMLSHRAAGALFHFRTVFQKVRSGDKEARIHLRKYDDFQEVADVANEMLDSLTSKKKD